MIKVAGLSKTFKLYRSPADRLKEIVCRRSYHTLLQALHNISFEVADGQTFGIIGPNGAGKSTLLKILSGIILPDSGTIHTDGKVTGLLELGTGFNPEMTGLQNIYMNGLLLGMDREELDAERATITDFSELGEFIYEPLKIYSSGMMMRLAFSIAIHANPKCFLVDEALSVGDAYFQHKCMRKIIDFKNTGGSIIFVSHDMNAVKVFCDKAILLNRGKLVKIGEPELVVNEYNFLIVKLNDSENHNIDLRRQGRSYGTFEAKILEVIVTGEDSHSNILSAGENSTIAIEFEVYKDIVDMTVGLSIRDKYGQEIFGTNTSYYQKSVNVEKNQRYLCTFNVQMNIGPGKYTVTTALHNDDTHVNNCFNWCDYAAEFEVAGQYGNLCIGLCKLYPEITLEKVAIM